MKSIKIENEEIKKAIDHLMDTTSLMVTFQGKTLGWISAFSHAPRFVRD
jgi:hypothetical protein